MSKQSPYIRYAQQAGQVAQEMLEGPGNTPAAMGKDRPGSMTMFNWASNYVHLQTVHRLGDDIPVILRRREVTYGMRMMSRFVFQSAVQARAEGLRPDTHLDALTHDSTFARTLGVIATQDNRVAQLLEAHYGLCGPQDTPATSDRYIFDTDGGIRLADLRRMAASFQVRIRAKDGKLAEDAICAPHRGGFLETVYKNVVPMYATHPALGRAVLLGTQQTAALPPAFAAAAGK